MSDPRGGAPSALRAAPPGWSRITGATLILAPLGTPTVRWAEALDLAAEAVRALDVAVARGASACPPYVASGASAALAETANDLLVFACPADIGIFEAAPLVEPVAWENHRGVVARFFRSVPLAALSLTPKIAWIAAHDWSPNDRVRWAEGDVEDLVRFATSPGAWRTDFVRLNSPGVPFVQGDDGWPFCFAVSHSAE